MMGRRMGKHQCLFQSVVAFLNVFLWCDTARCEKPTTTSKIQSQMTPQDSSIDVRTEPSTATTNRLLQTPQDGIITVDPLTRPGGLVHPVTLLPEPESDPDVDPAPSYVSPIPAEPAALTVPPNACACRCQYGGVTIEYTFPVVFPEGMDSCSGSFPASLLVSVGADPTSYGLDPQVQIPETCDTVVCGTDADGLTFQIPVASADLPGQSSVCDVRQAGVGFLHGILGQFQVQPAHSAEAQPTPIPTAACGGEIRPRLLKTLRQVRETLAKEVPNLQQELVYLGLHCKDVSGMISSWDIGMDLSYNGVSACGMGTCQECVEVGGVKQWRWDVNYILWGYLFAYCKKVAGRQQAIALAWAHKKAKGQWSSNVQFWIDVGFDIASGNQTGPFHTNAYLNGKLAGLANNARYNSCPICPNSFATVDIDKPFPWSAWSLTSPNPVQW